jgi:hypothetical protein
MSQQVLDVRLQSWLGDRDRHGFIVEVRVDGGRDPPPLP